MKKINMSSNIFSNKPKTNKRQHKKNIFRILGRERGKIFLEWEAK